MTDKERFERLRRLRPDQLARIEAAIDWLLEPLDYEPSAKSDFASEQFCLFFGDVMRMHHLSSNENFTKDKFEHGLVGVLRQLGHQAELSPRGSPGRDVIVDGQGWSLKTQADQSISDSELWISKFKELGRGRWETEDDLALLRDGMLDHMRSYDRIFSLRCLSANRNRKVTGQFSYELVEIPKTLLQECKSGTILMQHASHQSPKPGYCTVYDHDGSVKFQLYFDGGTERKLQIKSLRKDLCHVHAVWNFTLPS